MPGCVRRYDLRRENSGWLWVRDSVWKTGFRVNSGRLSLAPLPIPHTVTAGPDTSYEPGFVWSCPSGALHWTRRCRATSFVWQADKQGTCLINIYTAPRERQREGGGGQFKTLCMHQLDETVAVCGSFLCFNIWTHFCEQQTKYCSSALTVHMLA